MNQSKVDQQDAIYKLRRELLIQEGILREKLEEIEEQLSAVRRQINTLQNDCKHPNAVQSSGIRGHTCYDCEDCGLSFIRIKLTATS